MLTFIHNVHANLNLHKLILVFHVWLSVVSKKKYYSKLRIEYHATVMCGT